jgi:hypothetical protein
MTASGPLRRLAARPHTAAIGGRPDSAECAPNDANDPICDIGCSKQAGGRINHRGAEATEPLATLQPFVRPKALLSQRVI